MKKVHPYWTNYSASKNGSVYGSRGKILSPILHRTGYSVMTVRKDDIQKQLRIHRFVWECLNGEIPTDKVINHKNGIKTDNRPDNLELMSSRENVIHSWEVLGRKSLKGDKSPNSKISESQAKDIIQCVKDGLSNIELGLKYKLHPNYISLIRHNKRWRHLPR